MGQASSLDNWAPDLSATMAGSIACRNALPRKISSMQDQHGAPALPSAPPAPPNNLLPFPPTPQLHSPTSPRPCLHFFPPRQPPSPNPSSSKRHKTTRQRPGDFGLSSCGPPQQLQDGRADWGAHVIDDASRLSCGLHRAVFLTLGRPVVAHITTGCLAQAPPCGLRPSTCSRE